jgi:mRNA interferase MazF
VTSRGGICWADLGEARGSKPAKRRPVLIIQADPFNASRLNTTIAAVVSSNTALAAMPGNVFLPAIVSGLPKDSVVNVTVLVTLDKTDLEPPVGHLPTSLMNDVDRGLRRVLGLLPERPVGRLLARWARVLPTMAERHQVIAVDLQGHGRTADTDRPRT